MRNSKEMRKTNSNPSRLFRLRVHVESEPLIRESESKTYENATMLGYCGKITLNGEF